ncbi:hypothetical protein EDB84DRAFT_626342 [Lactarius hengduanensis]|nr:hypothetical protein EDB84DRAFT_626342 [Lactarius hengduanensis]
MIIRDVTKLLLDIVLVSLHGGSLSSQIYEECATPKLLKHPAIDFGLTVGERVASRTGVRRRTTISIAGHVFRNGPGLASTCPAIHRKTIHGHSERLVWSSATDGPFLLTSRSCPDPPDAIVVQWSNPR